MRRKTAKQKSNETNYKHNSTYNYANYADEDIYTAEGLENCFDEGLISSAEEGFMLGYLNA